MTIGLVDNDGRMERRDAAFLSLLQTMTMIIIKHILIVCLCQLRLRETIGQETRNTNTQGVFLVVTSDSTSSCA